jgi:hypothetical protein
MYASLRRGPRNKKNIFFLRPPPSPSPPIYSPSLTAGYGKLTLCQPDHSLFYFFSKLEKKTLKKQKPKKKRKKRKYKKGKKMKKKWSCPFACFYFDIFHVKNENKTK